MSTGVIQDVMLNLLRKQSIFVTIFLINGYQIKGIIKAFDNFTVVLESEQHRQTMVYKHAISSVNPAMPVDIVSSIKSE